MIANKKQAAILRRVANRIEADPWTFDQGNWCGMAHCVAGHICEDAGAILEGYDVANINGEKWLVCTIAKRELGLDYTPDIFRVWPEWNRERNPSAAQMVRHLRKIAAGKAELE